MKFSDSKKGLVMNNPEDKFFPLVARRPEEIKHACGPAVDSQGVSVRMDWLCAVAQETEQTEFVTNHMFQEPDIKTFYDFHAIVQSLEPEIAPCNRVEYRKWFYLEKNG